jgi:hypothetical protein
MIFQPCFISNLYFSAKGVEIKFKMSPYLALYFRSKCSFKALNKEVSKDNQPADRMGSAYAIDGF